MKQLQFLPCDWPKRLTIKSRLKYGRSENYNWRSRIRWYPVGWKFNHQVIGGVFSRLHYLAEHAPAPIQKKWRGAYQAFLRRHIPVRASVRYREKFSAERWL